MNITNLLHALQGTIIAQHIVFSDIPDQAEIIMVDLDTSAESGQIYLAFPETLHRFLGAAEVPITVLTCDAVQVIPDIWRKHNLIQTNLKISTLYNIVHRWVLGKSAGGTISALLTCSTGAEAEQIAQQLAHSLSGVPYWVTLDFPEDASLISVADAFPSWNLELIDGCLWMLGGNIMDQLERLSSLMQELHTSCCVGLPAYNLAQLPALAKLTREALELALEQAKTTPDASPQVASGVYLAQDEIPALLCRYASQQMRLQCGSSVLDCMVHPLVRRLYEYDASHETDLAFFLFQYLLSGNNITATANGMHIHRNTAYNWLRLIQQMQDITRIGGYEHFWLLLSCMMTNYLWQNEGAQLPKTPRLHGKLAWLK